MNRFFTFVGVIAFAAFLGLWVISTLPDWSYGGPNHQLKGVGTIFGIAGYTLLSVSFFLSSRWKPLENWIGGLDRIYHYHHKAGVWGFIILLIHPLILASKWFPYRMDKFYLFVFPVHGRMSVNLGSWALWLMIVIIGITLLKLLRYDRWKIVHKGMTLVFILSTLHFLLSERKFSYSPVSEALLFIPMGLGLFGILYKQVFSPFFYRPLFEVIKTKPLSDNVLELILQPKEKGLRYIPGQYVFVSFIGQQLTRETHPFTILESPKERTISIIVKARGDFTRALHKYIEKGYQARLEGPYGRFDYSKAGNEQIWIAGGIGIAPFVSWIRHLKKNHDLKRKIDLFYCVHRKIDAIFLDEFNQFGHLSSNFRCHVFCSEEKNRLDVKKMQSIIPNLKKKQILLCGPKKLTKDLTEQLHRLGVEREDIFFEDFEFF